MVPKVCSRSHGQPVPGVRSAAMISSSRAISREGVIARSTTEGTRTADHTMLAVRCPASSVICPQASPARPWPGRGARAAAFLLVPGSLGLAARLEQEPTALFGFVNEILQKAGGRHVLVLVGNLVGRAHVVHLRLIVVHELQQHINGGNVVLVVVLDPLQLRNMPDRADRGVADLACALGQNIDTPCELIALLIEQEVVVAEMRAADVPVEVLGLHVERKRVRDQGIQRGRYFAEGYEKEGHEKKRGMGDLVSAQA